MNNVFFCPYGIKRISIKKPIAFRRYSNTKWNHFLLWVLQTIVLLQICLCTKKWIHTDYLIDWIIANEDFLFAWLLFVCLAFLFSTKHDLLIATSYWYWNTKQKKGVAISIMFCTMFPCNCLVLLLVSNVAIIGTFSSTHSKMAVCLTGWGIFATINQML